MTNLIKLYGFHATFHALANSERSIKKIFLTENARQKIITLGDINLEKFNYKITTTKELSSELPQGAVHQGIMLLCSQKKLITFNDNMLNKIDKIIMLDNISDPRNIGAIMRTAAAFGFSTIITTHRFDKLDEGLIAKSSSGGLEYVNVVSAKNLSNMLETLKKNNFWLIGFDSDAASSIDDMNFGKNDKFVLIFGDEGRGIRNLTKSKCHQVYKLNTIGKIKSLNVSVAIGVTLNKISENY
ncbi:MAG: 23S rRNA (guanosine(2251)-2'-O)-methyltransferase RlmB [Rhodobiaceae bacterium]|nr:23S rRNA (guanosine(2251)-2'-O)-methyltransferase RlmB [Rhodobiaceae bacterium]|tara:strand:+ start:150 stop:875 length:726 start_codon:yes stop_codon:yes gene_type:complete